MQQQSPEQVWTVDRKDGQSTFRHLGSLDLKTLKIITGDTKMSPYRSGPMLVRLFNEFGWNAFYGPGCAQHWRDKRSERGRWAEG